MEEHTFVTVNGLRVKIKMSFIHSIPGMGTFSI